jgi:hypothetical protein
METVVNEEPTDQTLLQLENEVKRLERAIAAENGGDNDESN